MADKRKKWKPLLLASSLVLIGIIGVTVAFLTDTESKDNIVTFGNIDLKLTEEQFPEEPETVTPGKIVDKDPVLTSTGSHDEYVFMEVRIPKYEVTLLYEQEEYTVDADAGDDYVLFGYIEGTEAKFCIKVKGDGTEPDLYFSAEQTYDGNFVSKTEIDASSLTLTPVGNLSFHYEGEKKGDASYQEIFRVIADGTTTDRVFTGTVPDTVPTEFIYHSGSDDTEGWVFLGLSEDSDTERIYVFGYNTKLDAKDGDDEDQTLSLFDHVQLKSFIDEEILGKKQADGSYEGKAVNINVSAFGIQADNLDLDDLDEDDNGYLSVEDLNRVYAVLNAKLGR